MVPHSHDDLEPGNRTFAGAPPPLPASRPTDCGGGLPRALERRQEQPVERPRRHARPGPVSGPRPHPGVNFFRVSRVEKPGRRGPRRAVPSSTCRATATPKCRREVRGRFRADLPSPTSRESGRCACASSSWTPDTILASATRHCALLEHSRSLPRGRQTDDTLGHGEARRRTQGDRPGPPAAPRRP